MGVLLFSIFSIPNSSSWGYLDFFFHIDDNCGVWLTVRVFARGSTGLGRHIEMLLAPISELACFFMLLKPQSQLIVFPWQLGGPSSFHGDLPSLILELSCFSTRSRARLQDASHREPLASGWCWTQTWQRTDLPGFPELQWEILLCSSSEIVLLGFVLWYNDQFYISGCK